jgi:pseudouridine-5'-phosphate glycosidase/pseudouridine kinase
MEQTIRDYGAVPATICILDGIARIGLSQDQIKQMGEAVGKPKLSKASRRDLPFLTGIVRQLYLLFSGIVA